MLSHDKQHILVKSAIYSFKKISNINKGESLTKLVNQI